MEILEIKPSNRLVFRIPGHLEQKFTLANLTLRTVGIHIVSLHPEALSITPCSYLMQAFQELEVSVLMHWTQEVHSVFKSKLRVYIWQNYEEEPLEDIKIKMFNRQSDGNCLMFEEMTVQCCFEQILQPRGPSYIPIFYFMRRITLPNSHLVQLSKTMSDNLLNHCEKIGKVKAIYTFGQQFVIEYAHCDDVLGSFCEIRDQREGLALFGVGALMGMGSTNCSPDYVLLDKVQAVPIRKKEKPDKIQKIHMQSQIIMPQEHLPGNIQVRHSMIQPSSVPAPSEEKFLKKMIKPFKKKQSLKNSFIIPQTSYSSTKNRTRSKSQQTVRIDISEVDEEHQTQQSTAVDPLQYKSFRFGQSFQSKVQVQYNETMMEFGKKVLNFQVSLERKLIYVLLKDTLIVCSLENLSEKRVIKFDGIDSDSLHLPTPMLLFDSERTVIFANQSYLFWVSLNGSFEPDWKYVQRKEIYAIEIVQELNLLIVGGKNFSKLSYLGKSTSRSNLKIYSCGKTGKRDHLFTYDIPDCNSESVMELKYVSTRPKGTKLLLMLTSGAKLFFLRVRAFNELQVYSVMSILEIGIQEIISMRYYAPSSVLVCLERLDKDYLCFKFLKSACSYEKVEITTESVKLPVSAYTGDFRIGGEEGNEWISAVDRRGSIWTLYLQWNEPNEIPARNGVKGCFLLPHGGMIFHEPTAIKFKLPKI